MPVSIAIVNASFDDCEQQNRAKSQPKIYPNQGKALVARMI